MIRTIGELKKAISNIDDDFTIDVRIVRELSEEELSGSSYPYPYEYIKANLEIGDIGYSDKNVLIHIDGISDDVCEWKVKSNYYVTECSHDTDVMYGLKQDFKFCPYCGKKIKVVD